MVPKPRNRVRRSTSRSAGDVARDDGRQRLQKILAASGLGSRRQCEELILAGRVQVDGRTVAELGARCDAENQEIRVDGTPLAQPKRVYFMIHKPPGVVSTNRDPSGRTRVIDLVGYPGHLFTVGRLDMSSEGLILATNDGELANLLMHPRYEVEKTYQVEVAGALDEKQLTRLRKGVHLAEGFARAVSIKVKRAYRNSTLLEIVLAEGRNREIRRVLARVGHKVERLKRIALGPLRLADLERGHVRELSRGEVRELRSAARQLATRASSPAGERRRPGSQSIKSEKPAAASAVATVARAKPRPATRSKPRHSAQPRDHRR